MGNGDIIGDIVGKSYQQYPLGCVYMVDSNLSMLALRQRFETFPGMDPVILFWCRQQNSTIIVSLQLITPQKPN
jgi:hypothetical protein